MKKILFAAVAVMAMAACSNEDVISRPQSAAITFDNAFVENSTRAADINASNLANFGVYGSVVNSSNQQGMIFANQEVTGSKDNGYSYTPAQYWIAGAKYDFVAFAPYQTGANATWTYAPAVGTAAQNGTITFDNAKAGANQDFLFAATSCNTPNSFTTAPAAVGFTFNHMLSRVKFEFTNGFAAANNITFRVREATITNLHKSGTLKVTNGVVAEAWSVADNTVVENVENKNVFAKNFGDVNIFEDTAPKGNIIAAGAKASSEHFYLIPAKASYNLTFKVDIIQAGVELDTYNRTATVQLDMQKGHSYVLRAKLDANNISNDKLNPIEFDVTDVTAWEQFTDEDAEDINIPQNN